MELRHLHYFVAVAEELHFGRAAQRVNIAQPPLSQQIKALETELGAALFVRTRRKVELTHAGRMLLPEARAILAHTERTVDMVRRAARGMVGVLRVGFVGSATYDDFVPSILRRYRERYGQVELALQEMTSAQQMVALRAHTLDVGFARPPIVDDLVTALPIRTERLCAALPADHPLAKAHQLEAVSLADEPFVMLPRALGLGYYMQVMSLCTQAGFTPRVVQEAAEMHTIISLVAAGIGISIAPDSARGLRTEAVVYVPISHAEAQTEMVLLHHRDDTSPLVHGFLHVASSNATAG